MDTPVKLKSHLLEDVYAFIENKVTGYMRDGHEPNRVRMGTEIFKEVTDPDNYFQRGDIDDPPIRVKRIGVANFKYELDLVEDTSLDPQSIYVDRANGIERALHEINKS